ncbi:MAG: siphovirus Gp157 family protein [Phascolarctobacterium sp.]|nr:siphovirus Gp157 family protein [Phascolarctobacterium sp.]
MKLYEINKQLERLLELDEERMVDAETGEILTAEQVDELVLAREEKIEGCLLFVKNKLAEAEALKAEIEKLTARMKAAKNKADWCKEYVRMELNGEKFSTARVAVSYGKSKLVYIDEGATLPEEFVRTKTIVEADKVALKKALEAGIDIPGVELLEKQTIRIK